VKTCPVSLKLEMPVIRELLSREEIQVAEAPADSPAMATGEATVKFLSACCRLMDLLDTPQDVPFLSGLIQREIKQLRLQAARGRMLIDGLDAASAAFEVGYESASQFNREYSRSFGQPAMRDIRTLRSPGALPLESVSNRQSAT
jgi:AraC-like DNA-binding protein